MAMMITKFNKLIRNRVVWIIFTVVVVISFAFVWGVSTTVPNSGGAPQMANDAGELNGETVSYDAYRQARFNTYLGLVLATGRAINITPELEDELHNMAWQRIASLAEADRMGISSTDQEVVNSIQNFEFLRPNGQYNPQAYDQFAAQFLAPLRASKRDFEEHVRQEIVLQKLRIVIDRLNLISPMEVSRTFETLSDTFDVEYVRLTRELVADGVTVTEEDARAFFEEDPSRFTLAERVKVKAVVFPVADFIDSAQISDEEITEYYDFNIDQFAEDTGEDAGTNAFSTAMTTYKPVEEVRDEIADRLAAMQGGILAENRANDFIQALADRRSQGRAAFDAVASEFGLETIMVEPFTIRQVPEEVEAGPAVVRAAFNLTDDPDYYYSDPVAGSNYVYVLSLIERQPERIPAFEEVADDVETVARAEAVGNALTEKGQKLIEESRDTIAGGGTFADVLAKYDMKPVELEPFSLNTTEPDESFPTEIIRDVLVCNAGEFTDLIPADDGGILIAHVKTRTPTTDTTETAMRQQIVSTLRRQSSQVSFSDFQQYLLAKGGFVDFLRREPASGDEESAEDESGV